MEAASACPVELVARSLSLCQASGATPLVLAGRCLGHRRHRSRDGTRHIPPRQQRLAGGKGELTSCSHQTTADALGWGTLRCREAIARSAWRPPHAQDALLRMGWLGLFDSAVLATLKISASLSEVPCCA